MRSLPYMQLIHPYLFMFLIMQALIIIPTLFIGTTEIIIIAAVIFLFYGGKKLPEMMHGLGKGMSEFKRGTEQDGNMDKKRER